MALSTVFLGILLLMVALQRRYIANRNYETVTGRGFSVRRTPLGRWRYPAFALVLMLRHGRYNCAHIVVAPRHVHEIIRFLQHRRSVDTR